MATKAPAAKVTAAPKFAAPKVAEPEPEEEVIPEVVESAAIEEVDESEDTEVADGEVDLEALAETLGLDMAFESRPTRTSAGRVAAPTVPWELIFEGIRENPGNDTRIKLFEGAEDSPAKSRSAALARQIRVRLFQQVPNEVWNVTHRFDANPTEVVNADGTAGRVGPSWKVYVMFEKFLDEAETADRIAKRAAIAARLHDARQASLSGGEEE